MPEPLRGMQGDPATGSMPLCKIECPANGKFIDLQPTRQSAPQDPGFLRYLAEALDTEIGVLWDKGTNAPATDCVPGRRYLYLPPTSRFPDGTSLALGGGAGGVYGEPFPVHSPPPPPQPLPLLNPNPPHPQGPLLAHSPASTGGSTVSAADELAARLSELSRYQPMTRGIVDLTPSASTAPATSNPPFRDVPDEFKANLERCFNTPQDSPTAAPVNGAWPPQQQQQPQPQQPQPTRPQEHYSAPPAYPHPAPPHTAPAPPAQEASQTQSHTASLHSSYKQESSFGDAGTVTGTSVTASPLVGEPTPYDETTRELSRGMRDTEKRIVKIEEYKTTTDLDPQQEEFYYSLISLLDSRREEHAQLSEQRQEYLFMLERGQAEGGSPDRSPRVEGGPGIMGTISGLDIPHRWQNTIRENDGRKLSPNKSVDLVGALRMGEIPSATGGEGTYSGPLLSTEAHHKRSRSAHNRPGRTASPAPGSRGSGRDMPESYASLADNRRGRKAGVPSRSSTPTPSTLGRRPDFRYVPSKRPVRKSPPRWRDMALPEIDHRREGMPELLRLTNGKIGARSTNLWAQGLREEFHARSHGGRQPNTSQDGTEALLTVESLTRR